MIAELYRLAQNLRAQKEGIDLVHADLGKPGLSAYKTFHFILKEKGDVKLNLLTGADDLTLWTLKSGNFKYFPAFRPDSPMVELSAEEIKTMDKDEFLAWTHNLIQQKDLSHFWEKSLRSIEGQLDRISSWKVAEEEERTLARLQLFVSEFRIFIQNRKLFAEKICKALCQSLTEKVLSASEVKDYQALVFGSVKEDKNKILGKEYKIQIILDFQPKEELDGVLYSPSMEEIVLKCLNREGSFKKGVDSLACCSLTHNYGDILNAPYPDWLASAKVELKGGKSVTVGFGKAFKPYSKFSDAKCNFRYGRADSEGFPINRELASILVAAGAAITRSDRYGKTWKTILNGKFSERNGKKVQEKDIVIAYSTLEISQLNPVELLTWTESIIDNDERTSSSDNSPFVKAAQKFIKALSLEKESRPTNVKNYVRILILRQISNGQVQLVYADEYLRNHIVHSLDEWINSGKNLPEELKIPWFGDKGQCLFYSPGVLFPEEAINVLTYKWIDSGKRHLRLQSPPISGVMDLFFRKQGRWEDCAQEILESLILRIEALIEGAGLILPRNPALRDEKELQKFFSRETSSLLMKSLSLVGTLLYYLNPDIKKYMKEIPYIFGKLLAGMDELHKSYCFCVRDGNIPPSLIGNSALGKAADAPLEALAELLERSKIYLAWAKTVEDVPNYKNIAQKLKNSGSLESDEWKSYKKQRHIWNARNLLKLLEPLAEKINASFSLEKTMNTEQKAHLFLGYLSSLVNGKPAEQNNKELLDE